MEVNRPCGFCNEGFEDEDHLFRSCEITQRIWTASPLGIHSCANPYVPFGSWLKDHLLLFFRQDGINGDRAPMFVAICWALWLSRNVVIFRNTSCSPGMILQQGFHWYNRWSNPFFKTPMRFSRLPSSSRAPVSQLKWCYGQEVEDDHIVCVVDGAWKGTNQKECNSSRDRKSVV